MDVAYVGEDVLVGIYIWESGITACTSIVKAFRIVEYFTKHGLHVVVSGLQEYFGIKQLSCHRGARWSFASVYLVGHTIEDRLQLR